MKLEIVDIWHFGMSMRFDGASTPAQIAAGMLEELRLAPPQTMELREAVEALAGRALVGREFAVGPFWSLLQAAGMTPDELFTAYVGKNVLNFFRQDHGYKDGSYRKTWQGREDNEHLAELLGQLDSRSPRYADELYGALAARISPRTDLPSLFFPSHRKVLSLTAEAFDLAAVAILFPFLR